MLASEFARKKKQANSMSSLTHKISLHPSLITQIRRVTDLQNIHPYRIL